MKILSIKTFTRYDISYALLPIILAMPPQVFIGGQTIVLLKTVANETHTTIPKSLNMKGIIIYENYNNQPISDDENCCDIKFNSYLLLPKDPNDKHANTFF